MKFFPLILANLFRKKLRTILTIGSFAVAMLLFGLLAVIHGSFTGSVDNAGVDRLMVVNKTSIIQPLPISYRDQILRIPGVKAVTFDIWFGGIYQDPKKFFPSFVIDTANQRVVYPELAVSDAEWNAFVADREGAIVGSKTANRFGWKVGDRIPLKAPIYDLDPWEFNIRGIYDSSRAGDDLSQFWLHYEYFDERRKFEKGDVGWYTVKLNSADDSVRVEKTIDDMFANSPFETKTETLQAAAAGWVKQAGNIEFLILAIGGVVFFTLLLVTGNTMAIAVRERIGELAVLKAVGYSDRFILFFVLVESLFIAMLGGALGLGAAKVLTVVVGDPTGGLLQSFILPGSAILLGLAAAFGVGVLAGIIPAVSAMRLRVVDALRGI